MIIQKSSILCFLYRPLKATALLIKYTYSLNGNLNSQFKRNVILLTFFSIRMVMAWIKIHLCLHIDSELTVKFVLWHSRTTLGWTFHGSQPLSFSI